MSSPGDHLVLGAILVLAIAVRLAFFSGLYAVDDFNYVRHAAEFWKGHFDLIEVEYWHGMRPLVFVPISWAFRVFGVSDGSAVAWPFLTSIVTVWLLYYLGRMLAGRDTGITVAAVGAFLPLLVDEATTVLPGPIVNLLITLSSFCFVRSEAMAERSPTRWVWLALSGALFGAMPLAGHLGLVFGGFLILAVFLFRRHAVLSYWPLVAGFLLVMSVTAAHHWAVLGDPLAGVTIADRVLTTESATAKPFFYLKYLVWPLASHGGILYLAAVGAITAVVTRQRGALLVTAWFIATWLLIEFGSSSLVEFRPLSKQPRYLSVVAVPGALLAGIGVTGLRGWISSRFSMASSRAWIVSAVVLLVGFGLALVTMDGIRESSRVTREELHRVRDLVREGRGDPVYVIHWLWNSRVGFFMGYEDSYFTSGYTPYHAVNLGTADPHSLNRYVQTIAPGDPLPPGRLVLDEQLLALSGGPRRIGLIGPGEIPAVLGEPRPDWRLVERVGSVVIYEVDGVWPSHPSDR